MVYYISGGNKETSVQGLIGEILTPVDRDLDTVELLDSRPDGRWSVSFGLGPSGRPVDGTHVPTRLRRERIKANEGRPINDVRNIWGGGLLVSAGFKEVVERFEPGVHQFFPITIEQGGKPQFERFAFYVCNRIDTLAKDKCVPQVGEDERWRPGLNGADPKEKRVFDSKKSASFHAWHEKYTLGRFVSDALAEALGVEKLSGLKISKQHSV